MDEDRKHVKVVVWDNIGNTVLGMQHWDDWSEDVHKRLLTEDPDARKHVVSLEELFPDVDLEVKWLYDPVKSRRGFASFIDAHADWLVPIEGPETVIREAQDADFFILHKETLPPEAVAGAEKLRLIQHLGKDYRGVPMEAANAKGIPVAATALVNYSSVAEHVWAQILTHVKRMPEQREYMTSGAYQNEWGAYHPGVTLLSDLTLGLVGMGEIGRGVARAAAGLGMRVIGLARDPAALARHAQALGVPIEADALGRVAGRGRDADKPVLLAPAMNPKMWAHPAVQTNVELLRQRGVGLIGPAAGRVACGDDVRPGRMVEVPLMLDAVHAALPR